MTRVAARFQPGSPRVAGATIGARIRRLRELAGLTQEDLAQAVASHGPIVGRVERDRHQPTLETVIEYAAALGAMPLDLLGRQW